MIILSYFFTTTISLEKLFFLAHKFINAKFQMKSPVHLGAS